MILKLSSRYGTSIADLLAIIATKVYDQDDLTLVSEIDDLSTNILLEFYLKFVRYMASNVNLPVELIGTLTRRANDNLLKQNEAGVKKFIDAMVKIAVDWENEDETTVAPSSTEPTTSTSQEVTTTSREMTVSTTLSTTTLTSTTGEPDEELTTLGASSLSIHFSLLLLFLILTRLLK